MMPFKRQKGLEKPGPGYLRKVQCLDFSVADAIRQSHDCGRKQVEFQGKVWPGGINLGPVSL